jgi:uncharacterized Zn finger protein
VTVALRKISDDHWAELVRSCTGRITSLVALLRGELPDEVMEAVTDRETGLFPKPRELTMSCSCPDVAQLCKHLAAVLYGVGVRLDAQPELLFRLRGVDAGALLEHATAGLAAPTSASAATLTASRDELAELFGIELVDAPAVKKKRRAKR